jgi:multidrug efflux pump subunit AcrB
MKSIIIFSIKHPVTVLSLLIALVSFGIISAFAVSFDFLPVIQGRNILISAAYEGIAALEMRSLVTMPLEDAFASLKGLKSISSTTRDGISILSAELHWGTDIDMAVVESREIIDICYETLPSGCTKPQVIKNDAARHDTVTIAVIPLDGDLRYGRHITDTDIKPRFQRLNGVGNVGISGGEKEQIQVQVYRDKLEGRRITLQNVADTLSVSNFEYPAGTVREGEKDLSVKTSGLYTSVDDIGKTPLEYNDGGLLRINDIAEVARTIERKETFFLYNGFECIKIGIKKKNDASPLRVSGQVKKELESLREIYGSWYRFEIIEDMSLQIKASLISLLLSAIAGILATTLTIRFFLKSWKLSLVVSSVIPIAITASIAALFVCGKTINTISLSGIALGIGLVIDPAIVIVENVQRHLQGAALKRYEQAVTDGSYELVTSNSGSAITTIIVFIPLFFITGLLGQLFSDIAIAVISTIIISLVLSLTYIPSLCMLLAGVLARSPPQGRIMNKLEKNYISLLNKIFRTKAIAFIPLAVCVITAVISFCFIDYELLPHVSSKTLSADLSFPLGSSLDKMRQSGMEITKVLLEQPYVKSLQVSGGIEKDDIGTLFKPDEQSEKIKLRMELAVPADAAKQYIGNLFNGTVYTPLFTENTSLLSQMLDVSYDLTVLRSNTPESVYNEAKTAASGGVVIIPDSVAAETAFTPDRVSAARYSISAQYMAAVARATLEGAYAAPFYEAGRTIPVLVKFRDEDISSLSDLENTLVRLEEAYVPLRVLGNLTRQENEKILYRYNRADAKILYNFPAEKLGANSALENPGRQELREMTVNGVYLLVVTVLLLYLVLGAQFESFIMPLLFLLALPPSFTGALLFLVISGNSLNINSVIALIVLFGISVNNSILLYEASIAQKEIRLNTLAASCGRKLRAILVTTVTTVIAQIPFAFDPQRINSQSSLSIAVIGGLIFSLALVLTVIPLCFFVMLSKGNKKNG